MELRKAWGCARLPVVVQPLLPCSRSVGVSWQALVGGTRVQGVSLPSIEPRSCSQGSSCKASTVRGVQMEAEPACFHKFWNSSWGGEDRKYMAESRSHLLPLLQIVGACSVCMTHSSRVYIRGMCFNQVAAIFAVL